MNSGTGTSNKYKCRKNQEQSQITGNTLPSKENLGTCVTPIPYLYPID